MLHFGNPRTVSAAPELTMGRGTAKAPKFGIRVKVNAVTVVFVALSIMLGIRMNALLQEVRQLTTANHSLEHRFSEQQETAIAAMQKYLEIRDSGSRGSEVTEAAAPTTANDTEPWQEWSYEVTSTSGSR